MTPVSPLRLYRNWFFAWLFVVVVTISIAFAIRASDHRASVKIRVSFFVPARNSQDAAARILQALLSINSPGLKSDTIRRVAVHDALRVSPLGRNDAFDLTLAGQNREWTQATLSQLIKTLQHRVRGSSVSSGGPAEIGLAQQAMEDATAKLAHAKIDVATSLSTLTEHIRALKAQCDRTLSEKMSADAKVQSLLKTGLVIRAVDPTPLQSQLEDTKSKLDRLSQKYGPKYPLIISTKEKAQVLETEIDTILTINQSILDRQTARRALDRCRQALTRADVSQATIKKSEASLPLLEADLHTSTLQYERLSKRPINAGGYAGISDVEINSPIHFREIGLRDTLSYAGLGLTLCLLGSVFIVIAIRVRTKGYVAVHQIEKALNRTLLSVVPELGTERRPAQGDGLFEMEIRNEHSGFRMALDRVVTGIIADRPSLGDHSIAICSAIPGEGKTTISLGLARAAALRGFKVVLLDCDGRRSILSKQVQGTGRPGLVQVVADGAQLSDALEIDPVSGAHVLRHSSDDRIQDLSNAQTLIQPLKILCSRFDLVLLDTAPVLVLAEASVLATIVDEVILIARWRVTPRDATRAALKTLNRAGATVAALIFSRVAVASE